jgi:hypothetical protein
MVLIGRIGTMLRMLRASTPVESFCEVVKIVGMVFFVVLKVPEMLVAEFAIVSGDPLAIVWVCARLHLVDEVAHRESMVLCCTENQRFFALVDLLHEQLHPVRFAFLDLYDLVEIGFRITLSGFNFALHYSVIRRIDILVQRRGNLFYAKRRQEAVVDALLQRVDVDRLAEVGVGVRILGVSASRLARAERREQSRP